MPRGGSAPWGEGKKDAELPPPAQVRSLEKLEGSAPAGANSGSRGPERPFRAGSAANEKGAIAGPSEPLELEGLDPAGPLLSR